VRDAKLAVLRAEEIEALQQKTAEIARKNNNTKARKLAIEQAARVQIEHEEALLAQKEKEAQRVVDGENGAPREGEDGGEGAGVEAEAAGAGVAKAEAAAEEEAAASAQLSALELLTAMMA
jgi:hypothetical protein